MSKKRAALLQKEGATISVVLYPPLPIVEQLKSEGKLEDKVGTIENNSSSNRSVFETRFLRQRPQTDAGILLAHEPVGHEARKGLEFRRRSDQIVALVRTGSDRVGEVDQPTELRLQEEQVAL